MIMDKYYLHDNELPDGSYEIHKATCLKLPSQLDLTFIGEFSHTKFAIAEAEKINVKSVPCAYCGKSVKSIGH